MNLTVVICLSLLAVLLALALLRERRLRLALQALLSKLFALWRNRDVGEAVVVEDSCAQPGNGSHCTSSRVRRS